MPREMKDGGSMKVILLLAQCQTEILQKSIEMTHQVMNELEVETKEIALNILPSFEGKETTEMNELLNDIEESNGLIMISAVPMLGMHGMVQTFFDHASIYEEKYFNKPMMVVTYSDWLGEKEAAMSMLKCWEILGGIEGNMVCFNQKSSNDLTHFERELENFYRLMKQEKPNVGSSYREIFQYKRQQLKVAKAEAKTKESIMQEKVIAEENLGQGSGLTRKPPKDNTHLANQEWVTNGLTYRKEGRIDLSAKEQTIKELAQMIHKEHKQQSEYKLPEEYKPTGSFKTDTAWGGYKRPKASQVRLTKQLPQLPHCFTHHYDKSLQMILKYQLTDSNEQGYIVIQDGDCSYIERLDITPTVELIMSDNTFKDILNKKISYQKAFMIGLLKVKGNFSLIPKLDQVFQ